MKTFCRLAASFVSLAALMGPAISEPIVSAPVSYDNLSVYFVRGNSTGSTPLTLDQAVNNGQAKVRWNDSGDPITVENFSNRSLFIPAGTMLRGGLQDQVVGLGTLLPPHSGPITLATFCIDPFRSTARDGENPDTLKPVGMLPSYLGTLALEVSASDTKQMTRLRQSAVWWDIDTTRASLSRALGETVETPKDYRWADLDRRDLNSDTVLKARTSTWRTSLPLALESTALVGAAKHYVDALAAGAKKNDRIIGAVFAINGRLEGAEMFQSHALFREMWPQMLRARAIEALAAKGEAQGQAQATLPSLAAVKAFMAKALDATVVHDTATTAYVRNSDDAVVTETQTRDGNWVHRSFVAKSLAPAEAASPQAAVLAVLASGTVGTRAIASLDDRLGVILHREGADGAWTPAIENLAPTPVAINADLGVAQGTLGTQPMAPVAPVRFVPFLISVAFLGIMFFMASRPVRRVRPRRASAAVRMAAIRKAVAVPFAMALGHAREVLLRLRHALANFPPAGLVAEMVRCLGPAWPGNLRPATWSEIRARK